MNTVILLFLGVIIAILAVLPPGLLNISAAKIKISEGAKSGMKFSIGASVAVSVQALVATFLAKYINVHPEVVVIVKKIASVIFLILSVYFLAFATKKEAKEFKENSEKTSNGYFIKGFLLSIINVYPIPFQSLMVITLLSYGFTFNLAEGSIPFYVIGVALGSFLVLYTYMFFFEKIKDSVFVNSRNMNLLIGSITAVVGVFTLISLF